MDARHSLIFPMALVGVMLGSTLPSAAQNKSGTEGAGFLEIPVGAGPAAVGSAYAARANDAYAPVWNPAGLGFLDSPQLAGQHLSYLESIHYEFGSFALPLTNASQGLAAAFQYLGSGDIAGTDGSGLPTGDFSAHYGAYSLSYGRRLSERLALGVTGKLIEAKLDDVSAHSYAFDLGSLYRPLPNVSLAATVNNLGSRLKFIDQSDTLPRSAHLSAAYAPSHQWLLSAEGVYESGLTSGRAGVEWRPIPFVKIRTGYRTDTLKGLDAMAGLSAGLGLDLWGQELAYAWVPYGDLGTTQYLSFLMRFGEEREGKRNLIQYQSIKSHRTAQGARNVTDIEYEQLMQLLNSETDLRTAGKGSSL